MAADYDADFRRYYQLTTSYLLLPTYHLQLTTSNFLLPFLSFSLICNIVEIIYVQKKQVKALGGGHAGFAAAAGCNAQTCCA
jgi:hypothetical protein